MSLRKSYEKTSASVDVGRRNVLTLDRYILRDFSFDSEALERQRQELANSELSEKELWVRSFRHSPLELMF